MSSLKKQEQHPWHTLDIRSICGLLQATDVGLSNSEASSRLAEYGPNTLPEQGATPVWLIVLRQFINPLIYILVIAAVVCLMIGEVKDAAFISAVLAINAVIGTYQEWRAEKSSHALKKLLRIRAHVVRDGEVREVGAEDVVPGDVVWLESGNRVPADVRLAGIQGLEIDESLLTGESLAVQKNAAWSGPETTPVADQRNTAFAGSVVTRGRGKGVVVATGTATNIGQLALDVMGSVGGKPPLLERMETFTNWVAVGTITLSAAIGFLAWFFGRYTIIETFFFVVALAVSAIPEGLPVAMTVALAIATTRMAKRGVIVRQLAAVEGLGSCTLIATDKTGTLTCNELTVREICLANGEVFHVTGEGFIPNGTLSCCGQPVVSARHPELESLVRAGVLCNEADLHDRNGSWIWRGDAVDVALLSLGCKVGLKRQEIIVRHPQFNQIPFESEHQYAASFHSNAEGTLVLVKGAQERVLAMCAPPENRADMERWEAAALDMARRGLRVLAIAEGNLRSSPDAAETPSEPRSLQFLGFVGMIDPLRPGVRDAVCTCRAAGVDVVMVTGDHRVTALAIARDLGLAEREDQVVTGAELAHRSPEEIASAIKKASVFARVAPHQKLEIIEAARQAGHFVAVTGDGVNDAPALRAANIGVAMGRSGTDVAREASELVISDDNFTTLVAGIEEGRIAYDNIRKVIYLLLSMGAAELVMVLLAVICGLPLPLVAVQLLWLNVVTNGIQGVAIAFEPGEKDILRRRPRSPSEPIFNPLMIQRMLVATIVVGVGGFLTFLLALRAGWSVAEARNLLLLVMVLFENFHVANCRSETKSAFAMSPLRSPVLLFGVFGALLVHVLSMYLPFFQDILDTSPVSPGIWGLAIVIALTVIPAIELHKWWWWRRGTRLPQNADGL